MKCDKPGLKPGRDTRKDEPVGGAGPIIVRFIRERKSTSFCLPCLMILNDHQRWIVSATTGAPPSCRIECKRNSALLRPPRLNPCNIVGGILSIQGVKQWNRNDARYVASGLDKHFSNYGLHFVRIAIVPQGLERWLGPSVSHRFRRIVYHANQNLGRLVLAGEGPNVRSDSRSKQVSQVAEARRIGAEARP
jgi:hypothetical protein